MARLEDETGLGSLLIGHEFRILQLEAVIDLLMRRIPIAGPAISSEEFEQIRQRAFHKLKEKFPNARLKLEGL
jgi:hypothetical protein